MSATGASKVSFDVMSVLGVNGVFLFTGVPGVKAPIEVDAERIMRSLVLDNQVICDTVNADRASFEEGVVGRPDDPLARISHALDMERGDPCTVSLLEMGAHTGTLMDAPAHFVRGGIGIDAMPPDAAGGSARLG